MKTRNSLIKIHGCLESNEECYINSSIKTSDISITGTFAVDGNLDSRDIDVTKQGDLDINGYVHAKGNISVDGNIFVAADCECDEIECNGFICISGNCSCCTITAKGDVIIDGHFSGNIEDINVPNNYHIFINGVCKK